MTAATDIVTGRTHGRWRFAGLALAPLAMLALASCGGSGGISQEDAATIRDQIEQVADRLDAVEQRLMDLSLEGDGAPQQLISEVRSVSSDVGEAKSILTEVSEQLAAPAPEEPLDPALPPADDPLTPPAGDPLAPPAGDPLVPPADDPLAPSGDDPLAPSADDPAASPEDDATPPADDGNDPAPLQDPLVPSAPGL